MNLRYIVELEEAERTQLEELTRSGKSASRRVKRAHILLMTDHHHYTDTEVASALSTSVSNVARTRKEFVEQGLEAALSDRPHPGEARKLTADQNARLVALACSTPPAGRCRWTLRLLRQVDPDFIARMEDILDLYAQPLYPRYPVVCFDEGLKQRVGEVKEPLPVSPGQPARQDYHYTRNGTAKLLVFLDAHQARREVIVSTTRTPEDYARAMKKLADEFYPEALRIRVVQDNLNTHGPASLYKTFPAPEARRILRRLEFHYTPTHASWLNMVEIEIGVLSKQCLDRRIAKIETLPAEVQAWVDQRNRDGATISWIFNVHLAREQMARHYPEPTLNHSVTA